jgi:hypothetical protein
MGNPGTLLGMLVPPDGAPDEPELEPLDPAGLELLWPLGPEDPEEDDELGLWLELWDDGELLGELLGVGMLGEGMLELELGELGGGELLLDEQPASAMAAPSSRAGANRRARTLSAICAVLVIAGESVWSVMVSAPFAARKPGLAAPKSSEHKLNAGCTAHCPASSVDSMMATWG